MVIAGLARGALPRARLQDLTHDHVVDVFGLNARALERGADRVSAQSDRGHILERATELADGCARTR